MFLINDKLFFKIIVIETCVYTHRVLNDLAIFKSFESFLHVHVNFFLHIFIFYVMLFIFDKVNIFMSFKGCLLIINKTF